MSHQPNASHSTDRPSDDPRAVSANQPSPRTKSREDYIGEGVALGLSFGVIFSIVVGNVAFVGIGLPIGIAVAEFLYSKNHPKNSDQ